MENVRAIHPTLFVEIKPYLKGESSTEPENDENVLANYFS